MNRLHGLIVRRMGATTVALALLLLSGGALAQEIRPGVEYRGPSKLSVTDYGLAFALPKGWTGGLPQGSEFFLVGRDGLAGRLLMWSERFTLAEARAKMSAAIDAGDGVVLTPVAPQTVEGQVLTGEYRVTGGGQPLTGHVRTVVGKHGFGVALIAVATSAAMPTFKALAGQIARSLRFAAPTAGVAAVPAAAPGAAAPGAAGAAGAVLPKKGVRLTRFFHGSGYSEKTVYHLCSNGSFRHNFDASSASALGTGAAAAAGDGSWSATASVLTLRHRDGSTSTMQLSLDGTKLFVDGKRWFREFEDCR